MKCVKRFAAILLVCLVACSSLLAFPRLKAVEVADAPVVETTEIQTSTEIVEELPQTSTEPEKTLNGAETLLTNYEDTKILGKSAVVELKEALADLALDIDNLATDIEEKDELIDSLQNDLHRVRYSVDLGLAVGFKDALPIWGTVFNAGIKIGGHSKVTVGVTYMIGSFTSVPHISWNLDNLTANICYGWEF